MKKPGFIQCPEHGKISVVVEEKSIIEMRYLITGLSIPKDTNHTAKCPKCGKRLKVTLIN